MNIERATDALNFNAGIIDSIAAAVSGAGEELRHELEIIPNSFEPDAVQIPENLSLLIICIIIILIWVVGHSEQTHNN